ncbi:MAG: flagellar export chaperone FliS [Clostridiaceae bacterium]|nr:flagellar export chaperone FliS [Clostridiaceae bacterium]
MQTNNGYNVYKNNSINFASKEQLLLMLLDGALKFSKIGRQAIIDKNIQKSSDNLIKTQNIYYELIASLDVKAGGQWAQNLTDVYSYIIKRLVEANIKKSVEIMDEIIPLIEDIKNLWEEANEVSKGNNRVGSL